ncbi:MAG: hypothetical protein IKL97_05800, partial [Eggerthellaceae bacterium]|nr:hypothetical protein [Eggerthellaceae bacterium]
MRKDSHHSSRHDGETLKPEKQRRHEEGSSWASTPETRAREGVFASYQESQKAMQEQEAASHVIEDAPSPSYADSISMAHQPADAYASYVASSASSEFAAPPTPLVVTPSSSDASAAHSTSDPVPHGVSAEPTAPDAHPATYASTPVPVTPPASSVQPYDYYSGDRYDIYSHHQYDDYYLWDDYWLQDDYYGHDDYNPHLYYDIGTYPDAQSSLPATSYYSEQSHGYDSSAYRYHEIRWPDETRATEPFVSSVATAAGVILAGERIQEASVATSEPANQAFETFTQTAYTQNDALEEHSAPYLQREASPLPEFAQPYQIAHTERATVSSLVSDRQAEALFPLDSYGAPALNYTVNSNVPSPDYPPASTLSSAVPQEQYPTQISHTSSQAVVILPSAEMATVQHAINQGDSETSLTSIVGASTLEAHLNQTAYAASVATAPLLHSEAPLHQSLVSESSPSFQAQTASEPHAPLPHASKDGSLLHDSVLHQLQNQYFATDSLEQAPIPEASATCFVEDRQATSLLQDAAAQAVLKPTDSPHGAVASHTLLGNSAASLTPIAETSASETYLSHAAQVSPVESASLLHPETPLTQSLVFESNYSSREHAASGLQAPFLHASEAETLLDDSILHQLQNQPFAASSFEHAQSQETSQTATSVLKGTPSSPIQSHESAASRLTVNRLDEVRDDLQFISSRNIEIQPEGLDSVLTGSVAYSALHAPESHPQGAFPLTASELLVLQHRTNEARGMESKDLDGLLLKTEARFDQSKEFIIAPSDDAKPADARDSLFSESSAAALVSSHSEAKGSRSQPFETHGSEFNGSESKGSEAKAPRGQDVNSTSVAYNAVSDTPSKDALLTKEGNGGANAFGSAASIAALGTLGFAGKVAKTGTKKTLGALDYAANQLLRQDEDLTRVADLDDIVHDGVAFMHRHAPASDSDSMIDRLILSERSVGDAIAENDGKRAGEHVREVSRTGGNAGKTTAVKQAQKPTGVASKVKAAGVREIPGAVNAGELYAATKSAGVASSKADLLEKGPTGLKAVAMKASDQQGVEKHLLEKGKDKDPLGKKKPATERERAIEKKKADRKAARKDKNESKAMSVVKSGGSAGMKGALLVGGMAASSTKKALASRNEEIAVAMSTVDKTKKTVRGAKTLVKLPFRIYHRVRQAVTAVINTIKHLFNFAATLTSMGPVGAVIALALFFLVIVVIVILFATASIINDEQEVSEVSALVAELDADLTEEIHEMGDQPILYLDATETYNQKGSKNQNLTKDADLADDESDLQEVVASSVTVQTDPSAIAAYIDAKYTGNWQVGAASWKYTIDAFGETWNVIEWDDMPEWAWKGLNKINRVDFKITLRNELTDLLMEDFGVEEFLAREIGSDTAEEFATVIYDNQVQGINEEILTQIIKDSVKAHSSELELTNDDYQKLYYEMQNVIADLIGE